MCEEEHPGSGPTVLPDDPSEHSHISALVFNLSVRSAIKHRAVCRVSTFHRRSLWIDRHFIDPTANSVVEKVSDEIVV